MYLFKKMRFVIKYFKIRRLNLAMDDSESILKYYKDELKWNPPFAEILSKYSPDGLKWIFGNASISSGRTFA